MMLQSMGRRSHLSRSNKSIVPQTILLIMLGLIQTVTWLAESIPLNVIWIQRHCLMVIIL